MESPKRKAQKSRDYRRHRMMRLLNRRKATAKEAMSEIAEKELIRKLRITPLKKFEDGKDAEYDAGILDDVVITGNRRPANIMFDKDTGNYYRESTGDVVIPVNKLVEDDPSTWSFVDKNGTTFTPHGTVFNSNQGEIRQVEETPFLSNNYIKQAAHNYMSELTYDINNNRVVGGKYTMPAIALAPVIGSKIGSAAINSAFAAHGASEIAEGNITPEALLEVAPLGQLAKPLYKGVLKSGIRQYNPRHVIKQITAENAASMTPEQWTAAQDAAVARALNITPEETASLTKEQYEAAIARGINTEELSRLRLLHNSVKAPNNKIRVNKGKGEPFILDHDTDNEPWNVYDDSYFGKTDEGWYGKGLYLSGAPFGKNAYGKNTMKLFANVENPVYAKDNFEVGLAKQFFNRGIPKEDALKILESSLEPNELELFLKHKKSIAKALDRVYNADGVIVPLDANKALNRPYSPYHEVVVPDGRKVKSADAVTFDDNGVRIPLGKRDNFNINDIRYGLLPFGIGLTGLGVSTGTPLKKFEDGKNALLSSIPKLSNIPKLNFDAPEYEEIKPKEEIPIEPIKPIERVRTFNKDEDHPILTEIQSYVNSPVFVNRLKRMTSSNGVAEQITGIARENVNNTELKNWPTERNTGASYNKAPIYTPVYLRHKNIPIYPKIRWGRSPYNNQSLLYQNLSDPAIDSISYVGNNFTPQGISHERNVLAHEIAHSVYEDFENYNEYRNFTPEYRKVLDRGIQKDSFNSNHDNKWTEKIADIWSLQQFAKDNNIWDKSSDTEFTKEMYDKLKSKMYETFPRGKESDYHPNTRSFDMWNDEDLRWLINTTAQIKPVKNNIYYT